MGRFRLNLSRNNLRINHFVPKTGRYQTIFPFSQTRYCCSTGSFVVNGPCLVWGDVGSLCTDVLTQPNTPRKLGDVIARSSGHRRNAYSRNNDTRLLALLAYCT